MIEHALTNLIEREVGEAPGIVLSVHAPLLGEGFQWRGAAGVSSREARIPMRCDHSFRIASMSKTFTGLLYALLLEEKKVDLATPITQVLPDSIARCLLEYGPQPAEKISIDLLLHHRAGLDDFALSEAWFKELATDPGRYRAPEEIAAWALKHATPVGAPGQVYHYSDTGYVLLGLALEHVTGTRYAQLCRERLFDPLEMYDTYLEGHEEPRGELAHCYILMEGEYIDALQINGSCDWAAGGHVSTVEDIDRFLRGVFSGALTRSPSTLDRLLAGAEARPGFHYGMGVGRKVIRGKTLWGHLGHWGSFMYWCPEERASLCGMLGYDRADHNAFIEKVLSVLYQDSQ